MTNDLSHSETSPLITDEMVERALSVYYMNAPIKTRSTLAFDQMRAALEAVEGEIVARYRYKAGV